MNSPNPDLRFDSLNRDWSAVSRPGRSQTRFALGYLLSGFQPFQASHLMRFNELRDAIKERRRPGCPWQ